jgi:hypothetical protein
MAAVTTDPVAVEDTHFGEQEIVKMESQPRDLCACLCGCRTKDVQVSNADNDSATASVFK